MAFGHGQLDVYRLAIDHVAWSHAVAKELNGVDRHARDQLLCAAQASALHMALGNGKVTNAGRRRFFEIARGSALECDVIPDCREACHVPAREHDVPARTRLLRIVSMLTKLAQRGHELREEPAAYGDYDYDNDNDNEEDEKSLPSHATDG